MVWSNFTEPLEGGRLPGEEYLAEPSSGSSAVFPWQSNTGLWPRDSRTPGCAVKRSHVFPCKGLHSISSWDTSVSEARLWPDSQHWEPAASYKGAQAVMWLCSCWMPTGELSDQGAIRAHVFLWSGPWWTSLNLPNTSATHSEPDFGKHHDFFFFSPQNKSQSLGMCLQNPFDISILLRRNMNKVVSA